MMHKKSFRQIIFVYFVHIRLKILCKFFEIKNHCASLLSAVAEDYS